MELLLIFIIIAASSCSGPDHDSYGVRTDTAPEGDVDADTDADTDTDTDPFGGLLESGLYTIEVTGIVDFACEEVRPRDLLGATAVGGLQVDAPDATLFIGDARLSGGMASSILSVGGVIPATRIEEDDDTDVDTGDDDGDPDVDTGEAERDDEGDTDVDVEEEPSGEDRPDEPRGRRPWPRPEGFVTIEAEASSSRHAEGFMDVRMPDCAYVVEVTMDRFERDTDTDTDTETDTDVETDTDYTECDEEEDCG